MKALVTGGAGFIGSHLNEKLLELGYRVTIIDDLSTGRMDNIRHLRSNENFTFAIENILNETVMDRLVYECDIIFHLAASVGVELIVSRPVEVIETNILGTEMVLKIANRYKKKVLLTSTSEIYGKSEKVPFKEEDDSLMGPTTKNRWSYACSKAVDEFLALAYYREKKLPIVIARLFNTVGPRQTGRYGMVIPRFVAKALKGESDPRLRRWISKPLFHLCGRFSGIYCPPLPKLQRRGTDFQRGQQLRNHYPRPGGKSKKNDREQVRDQAGSL